MLTISVGFDHARQMAFYHLKGSITMHNTARKAIKICHLYCPTQIGKREKTQFILEKKKGGSFVMLAHCRYFRSVQTRVAETAT